MATVVGGFFGTCAKRVWTCFFVSSFLMWTLRVVYSDVFCGADMDYIFSFELLILALGIVWMCVWSLILG